MGLLGQHWSLVPYKNIINNNKLFLLTRNSTERMSLYLSVCCRSVRTFINLYKYINRIISPLEFTGGYLRAFLKSLGQSIGRNTSLPRKIFLRVSVPTAQSTSPQPSKSKTKYTHITADAGNGPCYYVRITGTPVNHSYPHTEVPSRKWNKLVTLKPGRLCKEPKGCWREVFKPSTDFIQFVFSEPSEFRCGSLFLIIFFLRPITAPSV
jgi:hypothetical protein